MNIFKVKYTWYEDDCGETLVGKDVKQEEFERDLKEARDFATSLMKIEIKEGKWLGKGYSVNCLPEYYETIIWFLLKKKQYVVCYLNHAEFFVDDNFNREIELSRFETKLEETKL